MPKKFLLYFFSFLLLTGCSKRNDDSADPALSVQTGSISSISHSSITISGSVLKDGGQYVTERGFCWGTISAPTIEAEKMIEGEGLGQFQLTIDGLTSGSTYYVRAYAINSMGVKYGRDISFTAGYNAVGQGVTDADGTNYSTVIIGNQEWMAENLRSATFCNGEAIIYLTNISGWINESESSAYTYMNYDESFELVFGKQYNIKAARDERNICPCGWHVPKYSDWAELISFLHPAVEIGVPGTPFYTNAGHLMKSETGWISNGGGNNASGFNALPGGNLSNENSVGSIVHFWSSDFYPYMEGTTRNLRLIYINEEIVMALAGYTAGGYVRCIKDN